MTAISSENKARWKVIVKTNLGAIDTFVSAPSNNRNLARKPPSMLAEGRAAILKPPRVA
jgi:hypothetical protein